jgi:DNA-binding transcriptional LysR family regulator
MSDVHIEAFDLNLLLAFDALWSERNVTRAARRIGLTQSALSHSLRRLREHFDDPLFERTPRGMSPTSRAQELAPPVQRALEIVRDAVRAPAPFDPRTLRRNFTIATSDYGELVLLPRLLARVAREAPDVTLVVRPMHDAPERFLASGEHDLAIGVGLSGVPSLRTERLFAERFVCVMRAGHPSAKKARWKLDEFVRLSHLLISPQGQGEGTVDTALRALRRERRVALRIPHFVVAPLVIAESNLVITMPERVVEVLADLGRFAIRDPPLAIPGFTMEQYWHARHDHDAAHAWLRGVLRDVAT